MAYTAMVSAVWISGDLLSIVTKYYYVKILVCLAHKYYELFIGYSTSLKFHVVLEIIYLVYSFCAIYS